MLVNEQKPGSFFRAVWVSSVALDAVLLLLQVAGNDCCHAFLLRLKHLFTTKCPKISDCSPRRRGGHGGQSLEMKNLCVLCASAVNRLLELRLLVQLIEESLPS